MTYLPPALQILLIAVAGLAGLSDIRSRRIPNLLVLFGLASGIGLNWFLFGSAGLWLSLKGMGLALAVYFPLFAIRAMGAGDAKLMAALGSITGPGNWIALFFGTAIFGGICAIVLTVLKRRGGQTAANMLFIIRELASFRAPFLTRAELSAGHAEALSLPHGAVIAVAAIAFVGILRLWAPR